MSITGLGRLVLAMLYVVLMLAVAWSVVMVLSHRRRSLSRTRVHPEACPCFPCREYEAERYGVCVYVTETVPGKPRDGRRLRGRRKRAWLDLEASLRGEQAGAG